jgi:hypothetical protein
MKKIFMLTFCSFAEAEFICHSHHLASMLTMPYPYEPRDDLSLHVEVFDGKFYLRRIIDERNFGRLARNLLAPENAYSALRTRQGIKLSRYLLSGNKMKNNLFLAYVLPPICKLYQLSRLSHSLNATRYRAKVEQS